MHQLNLGIGNYPTPCPLGIQAPWAPYIFFISLILFLIRALFYDGSDEGKVTFWRETRGVTLPLLLISGVLWLQSAVQTPKIHFWQAGYRTWQLETIRQGSRNNYEVIDWQARQLQGGTQLVTYTLRLSKTEVLEGQFETLQEGAQMPDTVYFPDALPMGDGVDWGRPHNAQ